MLKNIRIVLVIPFLTFHCFSIFSQPKKYIPIEDGFLRISESSLQTGKFKLISQESGDIVYLIGVVHVGEKNYYEKIKLISRDLDILFYEGVSFPRQGSLFKNQNIALTVAQIRKPTELKEIMKYQKFFARKLQLSRQVEELLPEFNWVNADVNYPQFLQILERNEIPNDKFSTYLSLDNKETLLDYNEIKDMKKTDPLYLTKIQAYKKKVAWNLVNSANDLCFSENMNLARKVLILERNKIAMNFVKSSLRSENPKVIGILFGAAHIPDFLNTLQADFGFIVDSHEWLTAWNLN